MFRFSIITVCLNAASTIEAAIQSVLNQTLPPSEYIIVDGGSKDSTRDIIERYRPRLSHVIMEPDEGVYDAFNKGIRLATGGMIGLLNADDLYAPWALETMAEAREAHPNASVFCGKLAVIDEARNCWTVYPIGDHNMFKSHMSIAHPATFVAREAYERCGPFDKSFRVSGDWDLMLRFNEAGEKFCPVNRVITAFRNSGLSSAYTPRMLQENRRIYKKYLPASAARKMILKMHIKRWGKALINGIGLGKLYARYRDERLLRAEAAGSFDGDFQKLWNELAAENGV